MREAVELIVKKLVVEESQVDVREVERDARTTMIEVRVAESDKGKIIGRGGTTVRAIRTFLNAAGSKTNRRYLLDIVE
jgi:predicted RNA-binding protein YlqC (UPF0109 family)